jgi:ferredoxin-fold anticodon binding domain-containing protein
MGAESTVLVTRSRAKKMLIDKVEHLSDSELEMWLDRVLSDRVLNCLIVSDDFETSDELREVWR